jgi:hypothetical protein
MMRVSGSVGEIFGEAFLGADDEVVVVDAGLDASSAKGLDDSKDSESSISSNGLLDRLAACLVDFSSKGLVRLGLLYPAGNVVALDLRSCAHLALMEAVQENNLKT